MKAVSFLFFLFLVAFPFGQLARLPFSFLGPEVHFHLLDFIAFLLVGGWGVGKLVRRQKISKPPLAKPIYLFSLVALASIFFNSPLLAGRELIIAGLYWLRWLFYAGIYFLIDDLRKELEWLKNLPVFLLALGVVVAFFGLFQYVFWPDLKALEAFEWDPHYFRVVSTFLDPGYTGLILVMAIVLLINLFWPDFIKQKSLKNPFYWLFGFLYLALALTYSRSAYLAYLVGMTITVWLKKNPKLIVWILIFGAITLLVLPKPVGEGGRLFRSYTIAARITNWHQSLTIARDHWLLGVGFNAYRYAQRDYGFLDIEKWSVNHAGAGADSSWFFVLATTGVAGLIAYSWLWLKKVRLSKDKPVLLAILGAVLVHSFFLNTLFYPWAMAFIWLLLATEN